MTDAAFNASVVALAGTADLPPDSFGDKLEAWRTDPKGLTAFTVPFDGFRPYDCEPDGGDRPSVRSLRLFLPTNSHLTDVTDSF